MIKVILLAFIVTSCGAFRMNEEEYVLKLADKCTNISITPQHTKLTCPPYNETKEGGNNEVDTSGI